MNYEALLIKSYKMQLYYKTVYADTLQQLNEKIAWARLNNYNLERVINLKTNERIY